MAGVGARRRAVETAISREARQFAPPQTPDGRPVPVSELFGWDEFSWEEMQERLPAEVTAHLQAVRSGTDTLLPEVTEVVAAAVYRWARERGANHCCRWTAARDGHHAPEVHEAFLRPTGQGVVPGFSGAQLAGEIARWDPRAPMFILEAPTGATLCIPCTLPDGQCLRAPLQRSVDALCETISARYAARPVTAQRTTFFLIDEAYASLRPDLLRLGRALFSTAPPTRQRIDRIPPRALAFLHEVGSALLKLGVPVRGHAATPNPSQFALLTSAVDASRAGDHDQLIQETLARIAPRHHLRVLTHPTPFPGLSAQTREVSWWLQQPDGQQPIRTSEKLRRRIQQAAARAGASLTEHGKLTLSVPADTPIAEALTALQEEVTRELSGSSTEPKDAVLAAMAASASSSRRRRVAFQASVAPEAPPAGADPLAQLAGAVMLELTQRVLLPTARAEPFFPDELLRELEDRCAALRQEPGSDAALSALQETFVAAEEEIADERWPLPRAAEILLQGV